MTANLTDKAVDWTTVGVVPIDSATLLLADPCYEVPMGAVFDARAAADYPPALPVGPDYGEGVHAGMAVETGHGDGLYPVDVRLNDEGRVAEVRVRFIEGDLICGGGFAWFEDGIALEDEDE